MIGCVSLWSPSLQVPHVKMLCHKGAITDLAINRSGQYVPSFDGTHKTFSYMVTTGLDCKVKVWDIRTYKKLATYDTPGRQTIQSLDMSHKGALALGFGSHVQVHSILSTYASRILTPDRYGKNLPDLLRWRSLISSTAFQDKTKYLEWDFVLLRILWASVMKMDFHQLYVLYTLLRDFVHCSYIFIRFRSPLELEKLTSIPTKPILISLEDNEKKQL